MSVVADPAKLCELAQKLQNVGDQREQTQRQALGVLQSSGWNGRERQRPVEIRVTTVLRSDRLARRWLAVATQATPRLLKLHAVTSQGEPQPGTKRKASMSPLFSRKPKLHTCFFCSVLMVDEILAKKEHYQTHLIEVTDNNGHTAFTFKCPRCGVMDQAWGGGRPFPEEAGANAIFAHLMLKHGMHDIMR